MFCYKCGKQFQDGINFCPNCGAQISAYQGGLTSGVVEQTNVTPVYSGAYNREEIRTSEINNVKKLLSYFSLKTEQYNEYDLVCKELFRLKKGRRKSCAVWGWILTIGGIVSIGYSLINALMNYLSNRIPSQQNSVSGVVGELIKDDFGSLKIQPNMIWIFFVIAAFFALFFVLPGVLMIIVDKKKIKKGYLNEVECYTNKYYSLYDELYTHYFNYKNCPIGPEYTNPANIRVILDTIISGRADTTKEAINILVEDAHRNRMENYAAQTAEFAHQAAVNAGRAARASTVGAVFSAANFFR